MDYNLLIYAGIVYGISMIPYILGGLTNSGMIKAHLMATDLLLTVAAYVLFYLSWPTTGKAIVFTIGAFLLGACIGYAVKEETGYEPYKVKP